MNHLGSSFEAAVIEPRLADIAVTGALVVTHGRVPLGRRLVASLLAYVGCSQPGSIGGQVVGLVL